MTHDNQAMTALLNAIEYAKQGDEVDNLRDDLMHELYGGLFCKSCPDGEPVDDKGRILEAFIDLLGQGTHKRNKSLTYHEAYGLLDCLIGYTVVDYEDAEEEEILVLHDARGSYRKLALGGDEIFLSEPYKK